MQGIQIFELTPVHDKGGGAVGRLLIQLGSRPVKDRHEIVGNALDAVFGAATDILAVVFYVAVPLRPAQLDFLCHGNGFHDIENEAVFRALVHHLFDGFFRPDFARLYVIDRGDNMLHARNLADFLQGDRVRLPVPSE